MSNPSDNEIHLPLRLTGAERKLILTGLTCLDPTYEKRIQRTPAGKPVLMTLDELEDFGGYVAAEANHCGESKKERSLDKVFQKTQELLDRHSEAPPDVLPFVPDDGANLVTSHIDDIVRWTSSVTELARVLRIKTKLLPGFQLSPVERGIIERTSTSVPKRLKNKLAKQSALTVSEAAETLNCVARDIPSAAAQDQAPMLIVATHLVQMLEAGISALEKQPARGKRQSRKRRGQKKKDCELLQFKITLLNTEPPIWRRIQVWDCTFDELHEHIQSAMGWTNSHLHLFRIEGESIGDPQLLGDDFEPFRGADSRNTVLSEVLPADKSPLAFEYEYDFGDGWRHEVLFEGTPRPESRTKYPTCLEGARACPPEDVGGVWGYEHILEVMSNPQHEEYEALREWCGDFDPKHFDPNDADKAMKEGFPDWRNSRV